MADDRELETTGTDPKPDEGHRPHEFPQADENFCSCCRQAILDGLHNVVRIQTTPERQLSLNGQELGTENKKPLYKAYLHANCWKRHFGQQVECEKCGVFSIAKKLSNGTKNECLCTCHQGSNHCSFILESNAVTNRAVRNKFGIKKV